MALRRIKNTATDTPGYLIDKFADSGLVKPTVIIDDSGATMGVILQLETVKPDLMEHLLKPAATCNILNVNTQYRGDESQTVVMPIVLPNGLFSQITFLTSDTTGINDFEIAFYGNDTNTFENATRWWHITKADVSQSISSRITFNIPDSITREGENKLYNFNFIAVRIKFADSSSTVLGRSVDLPDAAKELLRTKRQMAIIEGELGETLSNTPVDVVNEFPFIQLNIRKEYEVDSVGRSA